MQIFIKESTNKESSDWYILDLQGRLEFTGDLKNETLGKLTKKPNTKDDFILTIGNSVLNGKRVPLKKPLLVIKKIKLESTSGDDNIDDSMIIDDKKDKEDNQQVEYSIEGVAHNKISFTTRPTTFIPQSSVVYGSPTHRSPSNSPNNSKPSTPTLLSPASSPIKQPQFENAKQQ